METRISGIAFKAALIAAAFSAQAADSGMLNQDFADCRVATAAELGEMRGGFELNNGGLQLSFAFERVTYINGILVAITKLNLPSAESIAALRSIQAGGPVGNSPPIQVGSPAPVSVGDNGGSLPAAAAAVANGNAITLIQNGPKNAFTVPEGLNLSTAALTTVIQNTLDNQKISTATVINATLTSQALARAMAMTFSINQALAKSIH